MYKAVKEKEKILRRKSWLKKIATANLIVSLVMLSTSGFASEELQLTTEETVQEEVVLESTQEEAVEVTQKCEEVKNTSQEVAKAGYTGLLNVGGNQWYYQVNGATQWNYTGLTNYYGTWYYVEKGVLNWKYTGLTNYYGTWYYVENGRLNWNYTGLTNYYGTWYYVENGRLNWNYTGLTNYYGTWYYVEKGRLNWNYTSLTNYYGTWYYVENGRLNWNYTGLTNYYGTWYYVEKGRLNWNYTGMTNYYGTWYYVEKGRLNWNYTGTITYSGIKYSVEKGVAKEQHTWENYKWFEIKNGYACGICYKDITENMDHFDYHMSYHTHTFYLFPSYYSCSDCGKLLHRHTWYYNKPRYYTNSDEISTKGYWSCFGCGNQSSDGKQALPILVSDEGYEYGAISHWTTPFNFEKDSNDWIVEDESWEPADDRPYLRDISINGAISMAVGDTYQYTVGFTPANPVEEKIVTWASSDPSAVSIDKNGKATALKLGTATITADCHGYKATSFIRVTKENIGHVKSAVLCINGQSNPGGVLKIKKGSYTVNVETDPKQAVYEVYYKIEQDKSNGMIADIVDSISQGLLSIFSWTNGPEYTDSATKMSFWKEGTVVVKAEITDVNGDKIELSQQVIIE